MKSSKILITSLLAAAAMSAVPAWADIYTWVGSNSDNAHDGGWATTTITDGNVTYTAFNNNPGGSWQTHLNGNEYNTLRFIASGSTISVATTSYTVSDSNKSPEVSFNASGTASIDNPGFRIGGLVVETGATGFAIEKDGKDRYFGLGNGTDTFTGTINEDFSMTATGFLLKGAQNWTIASGKTMTFATGTTKVNDGAVVNISGGGSVSAVKLSGSGRVVLSGASSLTLSAGDGFNTGWTGTVAITDNGTLSLNQLRGSGCIELGGNATLTVTNDTKFNTNWTGTIKLKDFNKTSAFALNLNDYGKSGSNIVLDGVSGSNFYFTLGSNDALAFAANVEIGAGGLTLNNGYSNTVYTFSGNITGSGAWTHSSTRGSDNNSAKQQYVFTGDVSGYSGTMNLANASLVTFGNGGDGVTGEGISVSGTGTITMAHESARVTYNYRNDVAASTTLAGGMGVAKQGAGSLTLTGTNTYTGGTTVEAGTLIAGSARAFGSGALTVNAGAKVSANGYAVDLGAGNVTINGAYVITAVDSSTTTGTLGTSGTITFGDTGKLDVSGLAAGTYTVFGGTGTVSGLTQDKLYKESGRDTVTFADATYKTFTLTKGAVYNLTWTSAEGTWAADTTWQNNTQGGEENPTFADGDTVTFAASETAAKEISVVGAKDAQAVNVAGGDYAFSAGEGGSLSVRGALTVSSGASLTVNEGVLGAVSGGISLEADSTLKLVGAAIHGMTNVVSGEGKVVLDKGSVISTEPTISVANVLRGAISVEKIGNTKVSITAAQSYTGGTTITAGNIGVGHNEALGSGTITLNGGQITAHIAALTLANAIEIGANGGTIHTNDTASNKVTLTGEISGTGTLTKAGPGTLFIKDRTTNAFHGTLVVESGVVMMGQDANGRSDSSLTDSAHGAKIFVKSGATFTTHMGGSSASAPNTFNGDFYIASGATLGNKDGHVKLAGNIVFGATDTEGNFDSNATVTYAQHWQKAVEFAGAISGAGMVTLQNATAEDGTAYYKISGSDNTFAGTYKLTGAANRLVKFQLTNETAAQNATVNLSTQYASMELGAGAVRIAGLEGVSGSSVTLLSGTAASTLTVNQTANTTFAGTLAAGIALLKDGTGTLTLSGNSTFTGGIEIAKGVVEATNAAALGAAANAVRISGGQLKVGNVTLNQTNISVVLNDGTYLAGAAIVGGSDKATSILATGTTISVSGDVEALKAVCTSATGRYNFTLYDNNTLTTTGVTDVTVDDDFAAALAGAGWTYSLSEDKSILTISVPEPSAFGLLAGAGALALVAARRRRKKA